MEYRYDTTAVAPDSGMKKPQGLQTGNQYGIFSECPLANNGKNGIY